MAGACSADFFAVESCPPAAAADSYVARPSANRVLSAGLIARRSIGVAFGAEGAADIAESFGLGLDIVDIEGCSLSAMSCVAAAGAAEVGRSCSWGSRCGTAAAGAALAGSSRRAWPACSTRGTQLSRRQSSPNSSSCTA